MGIIRIGPKDYEKARQRGLALRSESLLTPKPHLLAIIGGASRRLAIQAVRTFRAQDFELSIPEQQTLALAPLREAHDLVLEQKTIDGQALRNLMAKDHPPIRNSALCRFLEQGGYDPADSGAVARAAREAKYPEFQDALVQSGYLTHEVMEALREVCPAKAVIAERNYVAEKAVNAGGWVRGRIKLIGKPNRSDLVELAVASESPDVADRALLKLVKEDLLDEGTLGRLSHSKHQRVRQYVVCCVLGIEDKYHEKLRSLREHKVKPPHVVIPGFIDHLEHPILAYRILEGMGALTSSLFKIANRYPELRPLVEANPHCPASIFVAKLADPEQRVRAYRTLEERGLLTDAIFEKADKYPELRPLVEANPHCPTRRLINDFLHPDFPGLKRCVQAFRELEKKGLLTEPILEEVHKYPELRPLIADSKVCPARILVSHLADPELRVQAYGMLQQRKLLTDQSYLSAYSHADLHPQLADDTSCPRSLLVGILKRMTIGAEQIDAGLREKVIMNLATRDLFGPDLMDYSGHLNPKTVLGQRALRRIFLQDEAVQESTKYDPSFLGNGLAVVQQIVPNIEIIEGATGSLNPPGRMVVALFRERNVSQHRQSGVFAIINVKSSGDFIISGVSDRRYDDNVHDIEGLSYFCDDGIFVIMYYVYLDYGSPSGRKEHKTSSWRIETSAYLV